MLYRLEVGKTMWPFTVSYKKSKSERLKEKYIKATFKDELTYPWQGSSRIHEELQQKENQDIKRLGREKWIEHRKQQYTELVECMIESGMLPEISTAREIEGYKADKAREKQENAWMSNLKI